MWHWRIHSHLTASTHTEAHGQLVNCQMQCCPKTTAKRFWAVNQQLTGPLCICDPRLAFNFNFSIWSCCWIYSMNEGYCRVQNRCICQMHTHSKSEASRSISIQKTLNKRNQLSLFQARSRLFKINPLEMSMGRNTRKSRHTMPKLSSLIEL